MFFKSEYDIIRMGDTMYTEKIKAALAVRAEEGYRRFSLSLIKGSSMPVLGVRLPVLRKLAADIRASGMGEEFLETCDFSSLEMSLLYAYTLGGIKGEPEKLVPFLRKAVYQADNWASCDTLCQSFKQCRKWRERFYGEILSYFESGEAYVMRAGTVLLLSHYLEDKYIDRVFALLAAYTNSDYYYKMGAAWCVATAAARYRDKTYKFLCQNSLDDITHNTAIRKITESRRISGEDKLIFRKLKR